MCEISQHLNNMLERENIYCILWLLFSIKIQIREYKERIINKLCNEVECRWDTYCLQSTDGIIVKLGDTTGEN